MHHLNPYAPKPPKKYMVEFDAFRKLTWSERLKILCGYNLRACVRVAIHRRENQHWGGVNIALTKELKPETP